MHLRVAHLLPNMTVGGRERMVAGLCAHGPDDGIMPIVIGYDRPSPDNLLIESGAPYIQLDRTSKDFAAQLGHVLRENEIDVVHAQGHISAYLLKRTDAFPGPKIVTTHIGMTGSWQWLAQIRSGLRSMDLLCAVSPPMAKLYGRISGRVVAVVPNGIALPKHDNSARPPSSGGPFHFAMLSRLAPVKRHQDAVAAMDRLVAAGYNVKLTIAGEGENSRMLKRLASSRDYVEMVGAVSDVDLFLSRHHAFIMCSSHEGMPLALIEAMNAGLPVIATAVGGIPEMINPQMTNNVGQLVPPKDVKSLTNAMANLMDTKANWQQQSQLSKNRSACFNSARMAESYHAAYRKLTQH
jgi:glycosyltransferase involved in cell wall biosynthesis